tara:strand:- start:1343 stop:1813 length:471 start_codon:yes stop_codon:yes gene_type:complete
MSNLPDDWGAYRRRCTECGYSYHLSGTEECKCVETFRCERYYQPGGDDKLVRCNTEVEDEDKLIKNFDGEYWCQECVEDNGFTCGVCGDIFPLDVECCSDNTTVDGDRCCTWCDEEYKEKRIGHHAVTLVVVEETDETTSERIIRAQIEGGINAKD